LVGCAGGVRGDLVGLVLGWLGVSREPRRFSRKGVDGGLRFCMVSGSEATTAERETPNQKNR